MKLPSPIETKVDERGNVVYSRYANDTEQFITYDDENRVIHVRRRLLATPSLEDWISYTWNARGKLTQIKYSAGDVYEWELDEYDMPKKLSATLAAIGKLEKRTYVYLEHDLNQVFGVRRYTMMEGDEVIEKMYHLPSIGFFPFRARTYRYSIQYDLFPDQYYHDTY